MLLIRRTQEHIAATYAEGKMKCPMHLCAGEEAIATGVSAVLKPSDVIVSFYRSHGHYLSRGGDIRKLFAELYGKSTGVTGGRGGSMLVADADLGCMGASAIVGGPIPISAGLALAAKFEGKKRVAAGFFGDGATEEGVFHETLNFAALYKLPLLLVCENNFYAVTVPIKNRRPKDNIYKHASIYGIPGVRVDGNDVLSIYAAAKKAVERARKGLGPTLLECRTYRLYGHVQSFIENTDFRSKRELTIAKQKDPLKRFAGYIRRYNVISEAELRRIENNVQSKIADAAAFAEKSPFPRLDLTLLLKYTYPHANS
jgi:acetoin:2,6-dichlorophenolindophenol oxidoreductase subunit alpha